MENIVNQMLELRNNMKIPCIGFGTYRTTDNRDFQVFDDAIRAGYRYFDTASYYQNEQELGQAIRKSKLPRESFQIGTKVWKEEMGYEKTLLACKRSLERLQTDYIDVYLIHWPKASLTDKNWKQLLLETWRAMEECYHHGFVKAIGVSNCLPHHLEVILKSANVKPMINQIEFHPGYLQEDTVAYCKNNNIVVQAWSPIGRTRLLENPLLIDLANKYEVNVPQICLRFGIQKQVMPLPKSSSLEHMKKNLKVFEFEIQKEDMALIEGMPQTGWSGEHPDKERVRI